MNDKQRPVTEPTKPANDDRVIKNPGTQTGPSAPDPNTDGQTGHRTGYGEQPQPSNPVNR